MSLNDVKWQVTEPDMEEIGRKLKNLILRWVQIDFFFQINLK